MSLFSHHTLTDHHDHPGLLGRIGETLHVWHDRQVTRRELAHVSERDLHDAGLSTADVMYEASKPFWQA